MRRKGDKKEIKKEKHRKSDKKAQENGKKTKWKEWGSNPQAQVQSLSRRSY